MTLILAVGRSMKWMTTLNICLMPLKKILEINYTYGSLTQPMSKEILSRITIFFIYQRMEERGRLFRAKRRWLEGKKYCKGDEGVYFGESCNRWGDMVAWYMWTWCFWYSDTPFERIDDGYITECKLGMIFVTWCIVKLYFYVNLCITCHIIILSNYIIHMGIKVIFWIWVVGDVTKIPDFSDHI